MQTIAEASAPNVQYIADLREAGDAIESLIDFRAFMPPDSLLVVFASRFRDDIREQLGMPSLARGMADCLGDMSDGDYARLVKGVELLLLDRYKAWMDDPVLPALLSELGDSVRADARYAALKEPAPKEEVSAP
jgi:hypothetical protein